MATQTNIGPCACCGAIQYENCNDCLAAITALNLTIAGHINSPSSCFTGAALTGNCYPEIWNGSFHLTKIDAVPTFEILFGTSGDISDPGLLESEHTFLGDNYKCYVWKLTAVVQCLFGTTLRITCTKSHNFMMNGSIGAFGSCTRCVGPTTAQFGVGKVSAFNGAWEAACNEGDLLVMSETEYYCDSGHGDPDPFDWQYATYAVSGTASLEF